ncbi:MAG: hypothetical protein V8R75_04625 [Oscillospiraceae bacterium]
MSEPFQNGYTRPVETGQGSTTLLDLWVPSGWETALGSWVHGGSEGSQAVHNLLLAAAIAMPGFILLAALGGYWIVRRAFPLWM